MLLAILAQPLATLAMPCHAQKKEAVHLDAHSNHFRHGHHHGGDASVVADHSSASHASGPACCGAGALCPMAGCAPSMPSQSVISAYVPRVGVAQESYCSAVPEAPVSSLYRPPIFL